MKLHLYAAQKSTSTWLRSTHRETLVADKIISAALRIRLNTTHDFSCPDAPSTPSIMKRGPNTLLAAQG